jgi:hypothetical protein
MWEVMKTNSSDINPTDADFLFVDTDLKAPVARRKRSYKMWY